MAQLIAADLGGTKVFIRCIDSESENCIAEQRYECAGFQSFTQIVQTFISEFGLTHIANATFGLPGPVGSRQVTLTNLPWVVDADQIALQCQIEQVHFINDFYAAALGVAGLEPSDLHCLQPGLVETSGNKLVVGAGTGLGVAPMVNCGGEYYPQASEGGHINFAPVNEEQVALMKWCQNKWAIVSYERLLSGAGLEVLYHYFAIQSHKVSAESKHKHSAEDVHRLALQGDDVANKALETFVEIYGAFIGNVALIWPAKAGIYIAGGIAPKIKEWMCSPQFLAHYGNKGRMAKLVQNFPIYLVLNEKLGLIGAQLHCLSAFKQMQKNATGSENC